MAECMDIVQLVECGRTTMAGAHLQCDAARVWALRKYIFRKYIFRIYRPMLKFNLMRGGCGFLRII
jgi:hypothetical protein